MPKKRSTRHALAWARRLVAYAVLALLIIGFLWPQDYNDLIETVAEWQFGQILAGFVSGVDVWSLAKILLIAILTWLLGRWFCGFLCPLGALMDLASRLRNLFFKQKFSPKPALTRQIVLPLLLWLLFWLGINAPLGLLEPYSLLTAKSVFFHGPNLLLLAVTILALLKGRAFCNSLCPTGFILKILAKGSHFKLKIAQTCLSCSACSKVCRANCVDGQTRELDSGRCLLCLDCLAVCPNGSLAYGALPSPTSPRRRAFIGRLTLGLMSIGAYLTPEPLRAQTLGLPESSAVLPPGALSLAHLNAHCSLCHSCVRVCPNQALVPATISEPTLWNRPVVDAYQGFCQYDCLKCVQVCPTGALTDITLEEKHRLKIGLIHFERSECVIIRNNTSCGACAEICPTGAVNMILAPSGLDEPAIQANLCVGCGACQQVCPVRPISAIRVDGLLIQQSADLPVKIKSQDVTLENDFPF
jgi:polyferredoxin